MKKVKSNVAVVALAEALRRRPNIVDGTGMLLLNGQWQGVPTWCKEVLGEAIDEIEAHVQSRVRHLSVNIILPGGGSGIHVDPTPQDESGKPIRHRRWHLPLRTNGLAWFQDDEHERFHMVPGFWHGPVSYWLPHAVGNDGSEPRMHLVCDLL